MAPMIPRLPLTAFLVLVLSRGRLDHPTVLDAYRPLPKSRRWPAWAALVLFVLTFAPAPFGFQDTGLGDTLTQVTTSSLAAARSARTYCVTPSPL